MADKSPHAEAARLAAADVASDFGPESAGVPASPFRRVTAQTPRERQRVVPNDIVARNEVAFNQVFDGLVSSPASVRQTPTFRMSPAEFQAHAAKVFGAGQVEEAPAATPRDSRLQRATDEQLEALEARLRDERDRRAMVAYTASLAEGDNEVDDLSDLTDADDTVYGGIFDDPFAETTPDEFVQFVGDEPGEAA